MQNKPQSSKVSAMADLISNVISADTADSSSLALHPQTASDLLAFQSLEEEINAQCLNQSNDDDFEISRLAPIIDEL